MNTEPEKTSGLKSLISKYRNLFRTPENLNHYSEEEYKAAERKFLKFSLFGNRVDSSTQPSDSVKPSNKS